MRILAVILVLAAAAAQAVAEPRELVTAADAILCLRAGSLSEASQPEIAQSQQRLRGLHCMRTEPGIPLTVLERANASVWKISFRPQGIPGGVTLWGRITSFTTPDGAPER
jgi:hypothetical protein